MKTGSESGTVLVEMAKPSNLPAGPKYENIAKGVYLATTDEGTAVALDFADLPVPERSIYANWVEAQRTGDNVEIMFGQRVTGLFTLRAALIVSIDAQNVAKAIHGENTTFRTELAAVVERMSPPARVSGAQSILPSVEDEVASLPISEETRVVFNRAAVMNIAYSGKEAEIRFYGLLARSLHDIRTGSKKAGKQLVEPIVRIDLPLSDLNYLCTRLAQLVESSEIPTEETKQ